MSAFFESCFARSSIAGVGGSNYMRGSLQTVLVRAADHTAAPGALRVGFRAR